MGERKELIVFILAVFLTFSLIFLLESKSVQAWREDFDDNILQNYTAQPSNKWVMDSGFLKAYDFPPQESGQLIFLFTDKNYSAEEGYIFKAKIYRPAWENGVYDGASYIGIIFGANITNRYYGFLSYPWGICFMIKDSQGLSTCSGGSSPNSRFIGWSTLEVKVNIDGIDFFVNGDYAFHQDVTIPDGYVGLYIQNSDSSDFQGVTYFDNVELTPLYNDTDLITEKGNLVAVENTKFSTLYNKVLTKIDLPKLLADGKIIDNNGSEYSYNQSIDIKERKIDYDKINISEDPNLFIKVGTDATKDYLYKLNVIFTNPINLFDSSIKGKVIKLFGKNYKISTESTNRILYLEENKTKLKLSNGESIKNVTSTGSDISIRGTTVDILNTETGLLSGFSINVSMQKSTKDYIKSGENFTDPIFSSLVTRFIGVNPGLEDSSRDRIKIDTDNSRNAKVTFTSALNEGEGEKTIYFAHDQDTADNAVTTLLADSSNYTIHVKEGEEVMMGEYAVINAGDYGRIIRLTEVPSGAFETVSKIQFEDVITGKTLFDGGLTVGTDGQANINIDGNTYYFNVTRNSSTNGVQISWGAGASEGSVGTVTTLFPRIKLAKGGWIAFLGSVSMQSNVTGGYVYTYSLPGIQTLLDYENGLTWTNGTTHKLYGNVDYYLNQRFNISGANNSNTTILGIDINGDGTLNSNDCLLNGTSKGTGAAVLFIEENKTTDTGNANNGDVICTQIDLSGSTTPIEISVSTPRVTNVSSGLQSLTSDSTKQRLITRYGTFVEYDSTDNDAVTIKYPDDQMYGEIVMEFVAEDSDNDGIADFEDNLAGNLSSVSTNIDNLTMRIDDSPNLSQRFGDMRKVEFKKGNENILEFDFNFSAGVLDLANLTINKQFNTSNLSWVIIKGINLTSQNQTKTVWIDNLANGTGICIIDQEIASITEMSSGCNAANEKWVKCPGSSGQYSCEINASLNKYKISGLTHSGIREQQHFCGDNICNSDESCSSCGTDCGACPTSLSSGGGGGGGGGSRRTPNLTNVTTPEEITNRTTRIIPPTNETLKEPVPQEDRAGITGAVTGSNLNSSNTKIFWRIAFIVIVSGIAFVVYNLKIKPRTKKKDDQYQ